MEILPSKEVECTAKAIVIRNIKEKHIRLRLCELANSGGADYYLKKKAILVEDDINKIKEVISSMNDIGLTKDSKEDESKTELNFCYLLEMHLDFLDHLRIGDNLKYKIEFIDLPGMDTKNFFFVLHKKMNLNFGLYYLKKLGLN